MNKKINTLITRIFLFIFFFGSLAYLGYQILAKEDKEVKILENKPKMEVEKTIPRLKIMDLDSNSRPIAVMINNISASWNNQRGLSKAYMVYEIVVESGITRFLALFKDQDIEEIGSIRSARHYFIDYALEHDAFYVHFGYSPQALRDLRSLQINNLDCGSDGRTYWRNKGFVSPHNALTSTERLTDYFQRRNYRLTTEKPLVLDYSSTPFYLSKERNSQKAYYIKIRYSSGHYIEYQYDYEKQVYLRSMGGKPHLDIGVNKQLEVKNIIVYQVKNSLIPGGGSGRQDLHNIGSGEGYYISNGYSIPITWEKSSREAQTIYRDLDGNKITLNDGLTFIQIQPLNQSIDIKEE